MNGTEEATRLYVQPVSALWWLRRPSYLLFMLREVSAAFVAWSVVYLLLLVRAARDGRYGEFVDWSSQLWVVALNVVTLGFLLLHSITWFNLAPKAMVVPRVPARAILVGHFLAWAAASAFLAWLVLR
jgi:fumarate reductase subunit C